MVKPRLLILGGTTDAVKLQSLINTRSDLEVITSLAGRTRQPVSQSSRIGGFGGVPGLIEYLQQEKINFLIDATHPFASQMAWNAFHACLSVGIPRLKLVRSPWEKVTGDRWIETENNETAAKMLPNLAKRVFLTIGRQELATYAKLQEIWFLMRMIDPPESNISIPPGKLLLARGPFSLEQERSLLLEHKIEVIVSKNSGGNATYAKIIAAREMDLPVVMIQRPLLPEGDQVGDVQSAFNWLNLHFLKSR